MSPVSVLATVLVLALMISITESTERHVGRHYEQCADQPCIRQEDGTSTCTSPCNCVIPKDTRNYPQEGRCKDPEPRTDA
uniref:8 kDa Amblyomma family member n=1 Tax=Rhipicephalus appendiculatus TaxID=34631 RepID=A0A131YF09_RHIAP